jgi:outer membrane protein OmpA-like peptidoglycan-associated protein
MKIKIIIIALAILLPGLVFARPYVLLRDKNNVASMYIPIRGFFKPNSTVIDPYYNPRLRNIAGFLKAHPEKNLIIHMLPTDSSTLTSKRITTVKDYFVAKGINTNRISAYDSANAEHLALH